MILYLYHSIVGVYVEDIPMKLSDKYKPLDFTAYIEDETQIPHLIRDDVSLQLLLLLFILMCNTL